MVSVPVFYCACIFFPASLAIPPIIENAVVLQFDVSPDSRIATAVYNTSVTQVFDCDSLEWTTPPSNGKCAYSQDSAQCPWPLSISHS